MSFNSRFTSSGISKLSVIATTVAAASAAYAQDEHTGLEEIVVTAEKRASTVQDTAIAVSAFDGKALEKRHIAIRGVGNGAVAASSIFLQLSFGSGFSDGRISSLRTTMENHFLSRKT